MSGTVVHSILEREPEAVARRIAEAPSACGLIEIRADHLRAGDLSGLVRRCGRSVVVAARSREDGGAFDGSAEEKRGLLRAALEAGAAFIDVEWNGALRGEADGPHAARTILSHHGAPCRDGELTALFAAMASSKAARLKIVPRAQAPSDSRAVKALLGRARAAGRPLAAFALGAAGTASRVFALSWGSWGTYGAAAAGRETAEGQPSSRDLLEVYRVADVGPGTRRFALAGTPVLRSPSPALHAAAYRATGLDAVYLPVDTDDLDDLEALCGADGVLGLEGFGVTIPLKEAAARRCASLDRFAACGAVNTVTAGTRWEGFNTDAPAALELVGAHVAPRDARVAVVGAGGTARAIAAAFVEAGGRVTLYARNAARGEATARAAGASAAPFEALLRADWDVLVQATPLGRDGEEVLPGRCLRGRMVLDAAYGAEPTPLVRAARARGLAVADGLDLLVAQAVPQFERLTGRRVGRDVMAAAAAPWRGAEGA